MARFDASAVFDVSAVFDSRSLGLTTSALNAVKRNLPRELHRGLISTLRLVEKYAKARAPVGDTGATRRDIGAQTYSATTGAVGTNQEAAAAIDQGTASHPITPNKAGALAIPRKDSRGSYVSKSKKTKTGRSRRYRRVEYKNERSASGGRHLDVEFTLTKKVQHPGSKPSPFLTPAARIAQRVAAREANKAVVRAIGGK